MTGERVALICRPFEPSEIDLVTPVVVRNNLESYTERLRGWWDGNPHRDHFPGTPAGWFLETDEGRQVGVGHNLPMLFDLGGRPVRVAIHSSVAVDAAYRSKSLLLFTSFLKQKGVDLCIVGSTSNTTTKIYTAAAKRIPSPGSDVPILWPVDYQAFAESVLRRKRVSAAGLLSWPAGGALAVYDLLRHKSAPSDIRITRVSHFDDRFDALWDKLRRGPERLRAVRTRATLHWRFEPEIKDGSATILTAERGGELVGYTVLIRQLRSDLNVKLSEFTDLQAAGEEESVIRALMLGAIRASKEDGAAILKLRAWNAEKRKIALSLNAWSYQYPLWQAYYKCLAPDLSDTVSKPEFWDYSPFEIF
jgi:hypothetical protein